MRSRSRSRSTRSTSSRRATTGSPSASGDGPADGTSGGRADAGTADLRERVVGTELVHRGRYLSLRIDTIERSDGTRAAREIVGHPGAVAILALDPDDRVLLVRQWRPAAGRATLEIPAGTLEPGDGDSVEDHRLAAERELEEETGYRAGRWRYLAGFWTAPGFASELMHLYLAEELVPADGDRLGPDEDERLLLERLPWRDAVEAASDGTIVDAKSILALLWLARLRGGGGR